MKLHDYLRITMHISSNVQRKKKEELTSSLSKHQHFGFRYFMLTWNENVQRKFVILCQYELLKSLKIPFDCFNMYKDSYLNSVSLSIN